MFTSDPPSFPDCLLCGYVFARTRASTLQSLGGALERAKTATSPNSPELAALDSALSQTTLPVWDVELAQAVTALEVSA